ncbi:SET domain-containing protein-lysine N-methyltransferase [Candidatus Cerribacteria bacterium 'Amazon FNV 2010 28 9']|uniref:SET domain-containing protein-lysine N-methyltransferase n=1 Tax=Candidatus Cerribacteria bacterium 'Amazon FNV 2010 28 9' TaxID=2081795 RepID=A0A317JP05_9BACT|nr:MAG: SET domain-containing protein-lysine N-methyltransferase [Candidatus Cerribacteria bacterium 'Amazon FNV 2010 28 9']
MKNSGKSKLFTPSCKIYLAPSRIPHAGRGVFARKHISEGDLIERCPVLELPTRDIPLLEKTLLHNYYFLWGEELSQVAIALGFGSLYNHSYSPNATYHKFMKKRYLEFIAIKDIAENEEITVNYNHGNPDDKSPLWMNDVPSVDEE